MNRLPCGGSIAVLSW